MSLFSPLMAANLSAFYPGFFLVYLFLPGPPLHFCGEGRCICQCVSTREGCDCGTVPTTTGTRGFRVYCNSWGEEEQTPLLCSTCRHCRRAEPCFSPAPLPCPHTAQQALPGVSRAGIISAVSLQMQEPWWNLPWFLVCAWRHSGGWRIDRGLKGKLFLVPPNTFYPVGCESRELQRSYFALRSTPHACCDGKKSRGLSEPTTVPSKARPDPVPLCASSAGAGACFSLPTLIRGNPDYTYLCACY